MEKDKEIQNSELQKKLTIDEKEISSKEASKKISPKALENIRLITDFFRDNNTLFKQCQVDVLSNIKENSNVFNNILSKFFDSIEELSNKPEFKNMTADEFLDCIELQNTITKFIVQNLTPVQAEAVNEKFYSILQGKATNFLPKIKTNNLCEQIDFLGNAEIKVDDKFIMRIINPA